MALGLPRRLAPVLPTTYSVRFLLLQKAQGNLEHSESPRHAFAHCGGLAPAAPLRARTSISVSFSGQPLSRPLPVLDLVSHYLTNNLIGRRLILQHCFLWIKHYSIYSIFSIILSFPRLSWTTGQIIDVLLSRVPWSTRNHRLAWLIRILIAATSCRINRYRCKKLW